MTTLPNMGLELPARGDAGSGAWADALDGNAEKADAHNHTTGKGARVPVAGLDINADVPFSSIYAPTQLHRVQFSSVAAGAMTVANNKSLFVSDGTSGLVANELYWRTAAGNNVRLTSGSSINISLAGAIGGDYSSVAAQLNYDDAGKRYILKEGASDSNGWARVASGDLRLYPFGTTGANYVGQAAPGGIGASYTATWPAALPGSTSLMQIGSAGAMSFSNTIGQALTCTATTTISNANLVLSGTADMTHAVEWVIEIPASAFVDHKGTTTQGAYQTYTSGAPANRNYFAKRITTSGTAFVNAPVSGLRPGDRITTVDLQVASTTGTMGTYGITLYRQQIGTAFTAIGSNGAAGGVSVPELTSNLTANYTLISGDIITIEVFTNDTNLFIIGANVHVTHP